MTTEQAFLQSYDASAFPVVLVTVDTVLFTFHDHQIKVLLVMRAAHPERGKLGLPGGFLDQNQDNSLQAAAVRSVKAKAGIEPPYLEQIETVGSQARDPRGWSVSVIYSALMPYETCCTHIETVEGAGWYSLKELENLDLAFDHRTAIHKAFSRYQQKALYSFVPAYALKPPFTITDVRKVHEALIGKTIQRKSFIRRVESSQVFIDTGDVRTERGRPACLYRPKQGLETYRFVRNIEMD